MIEVLDVNGTPVQVETGLMVPMNMEQRSVVTQYLGGSPARTGCSSCGANRQTGMTLGTANCGGPYTVNTTHQLTGSITSGGTAPFTYSWTITPPGGSPTNLTGAVQNYNFTQVGTYNIQLSVTDSCPAASGGPKTDTASCSVIVNAATCTTPSCNISVV